MRVILFVFAAASFVFGCRTAPPSSVSFAGVADGIAAPQSLAFRGETYRAGYSATDRGKAVVEYYRDGDGPKSWRKMLALRLDPAGKDSLQRVRVMEQMLRARGIEAVRAYQSTNGHGVEFILTVRGTQELSVFRYLDRANGLVSLQYAENISLKEIDRMEKSKIRDYYVTLRSNAVWSLDAMIIPSIEMNP